MFFKSNTYKPYGKSRALAYKPNPYDDDVANPFDEIETPQEYIDFLERENSHLYYSVTLNDEDIAKDDILEYILREYS
jgi:hypothetical protein